LNYVAWLILAALVIGIAGPLLRVPAPALLLALAALIAAGWFVGREYLQRNPPRPQLNRPRKRALKEALEQGSLADALSVWAASANGEQELAEHLDRRLDDAARWQVGIAVKSLANDLLLLERSRQRAIDGGVSPLLFDPVTDEATGIADGLWAEAARLSAIAVGRGPDAQLRLATQLASREKELATLRDGVAAARDELGLLVLSGGGSDTDAQLARARERLEAASAGLRWLNSPAALPESDSP
jgi:hypothetical protein